MPAEPLSPAEVQIFSTLVAVLIVGVAVIWAIFCDVSPLLGFLNFFNNIFD